MILYHYDNNGYFVGSTEARLDQKATAFYGEPRYLIPARSTPVAPPAAGTGFVAAWDGQAWTTVPIPVPDPENPDAEPVDPLTLPVTPRQIRLALNELGLRQAVEDYVTAADQAVKDSWEYSTEFDRQHPMVLAAGVALNKTEAEMDALFLLALSK